MAKLLDFMLRCNNATAEDVADDLLKMAEPDEFDSQDEMASHFEDCLGYDPFEYFDRKSIEEQFEDIIDSAPYSVREQLHAKRTEIIERTLECSEDVGDTVLRKVFVGVIKDTVGWQPSEDTDVSLDDCISMAIFGTDDLDDANDYESEDADEEEDDLYDEDDYEDEASDDDY